MNEEDGTGISLDLGIVLMFEIENNKKRQNRIESLIVLCIQKKTTLTEAKERNNGEGL